MTEDDLRGDPLFRQATIGVEVEAFIQTPQGALLWNRSFEEERDAFEEFMKVSPDDTKNIIDIQIKAKAARLFRSSLVEAIASGKIAENRIRDEEEVNEY